MVTTLVRLSALVGSRLLDPSGEPIGSVDDMVVWLAEGTYPPVTGALVKMGGSEVFVPSGHLGRLHEGSLALSAERDGFDPFQRRPGEVLLRRDVLGHKLIHIGAHNRPRLVRAADIDLTDVDGTWRVAGIDAARRRWTLHRRSSADEHPFFVDWADLEPFVGHVPTSRLRLRTRRLAQLYPADIADLVEAASPAEGEEILEAVGENEALEADVFEELDQEHQLEMVAKRSDSEVASLLDNMAPDDAADLLSEIDQDRREPILSHMAAGRRQRLASLLGYNPQTAGGLMIPDGVCVPTDATVKEALDRLRADTEGPDTLDTVYLVSTDGKLAGAVRLRELLRADASDSLDGIAHSDPPRVRSSADVAEVTLAMTDYNLSTLAVVDEGDRIIGVVTVDDVLELLVPEAWRRRAEADAG
ncbi:MAG: magnesium transporter MgtE N-terminal domain-containing protein [Acidimicrobiales bacterium]